MVRVIQTKFRQFIVSNSGVAAIEAAIALPVFLTFILGVVFLCHAIMVRQAMFYGLDVAGRQAMISSSASNTDLENTALGKMSGVDANLVTISATDSTVDDQDYKVLSSSYVYSFPQIVGLADITMSANVTVPVN